MLRHDARVRPLCEPARGAEVEHPSQRRHHGGGGASHGPAEVHG